jgi:hypothetical protein
MVDVAPSATRTRRATTITPLLPSLAEEDEQSHSGQPLKHIQIEGSDDALDSIEGKTSPMQESEGKNSQNIGIQVESPPQKDRTDAPSTQRRKLIPLPTQSSHDSSALDGLSTTSQHYLATGVIDYCIVLGR